MAETTMVEKEAPRFSWRCKLLIPAVAKSVTPGLVEGGSRLILFAIAKPAEAGVRFALRGVRAHEADSKPCCNGFACPWPCLLDYASGSDMAIDRSTPGL
jgi:hypothetical protein